MVHPVLAGFAGAVALSLSLPVGSSAAAPAAPAREMASLQYLVGTWHCTWTSGKQSGAEDQIFESVMGGSWLEEKRS
jgi:hypothetical protein